MNTKLVDSLVQIIESLTSEEQHLLEDKLKANKTETDSQENYSHLAHG